MSVAYLESLNREQRRAVEHGVREKSTAPSMPLLVIGLIAGVIVSLVQIVTSIHDTALAFVPRIVVTFVVFLIVFPWMMATMTSYTTALFSSFEPYTH